MGSHAGWVRRFRSRGPDAWMKKKDLKQTKPFDVSTCEAGLLGQQILVLYFPVPRYERRSA